MTDRQLFGSSLTKLSANRLCDRSMQTAASALAGELQSQLKMADNDQNVYGKEMNHRITKKRVL